MDITKALNDVTARLISRAWEDPNFKQVLLTDTRSAIEQATGLHIPANVKVEVLEETPEVVYLVLPFEPPVDALTGELSEKTLEEISGSGGKSPYAAGRQNPRHLFGVLPARRLR